MPARRPEGARTHLAQPPPPHAAIRTMGWMPRDETVSARSRESGEVAEAKR